MAAEGKCQHQMTLAELCQALEEGHLPYIVSNGQYELRAADLRRLPDFDRSRLALPDPDELPAELLECPDMSQLDFSA